jgi:hypothetical protein
MMPQPILELGNVRIDYPRDIRHESLYDAVVNQESNEPAHATHVFCRQAMILTAAAACAVMSCKTSSDAFVDLTGCRSVQPLGKVTGAFAVTRHCQSRVAKAAQVPSELLYKRPQAAWIHTPQASS